MASGSGALDVAAHRLGLAGEIVEQSQRGPDAARTLNQPPELEDQLARADDQRPDACADQRAAQLPRPPLS